MQLQGLTAVVGILHRDCSCKVTCVKKLSPKLITASRCPADVQVRVSLQLQQGFIIGMIAAVSGHLLGRCPVRQLEDRAELELVEPAEGAEEYEM